MLILLEILVSLLVFVEVSGFGKLEMHACHFPVVVSYIFIW